MSQNFAQIANELSLGVNIPDTNAFINKLDTNRSKIGDIEMASFVSIIEKSDGVPKIVIDWVIGKLAADIIKKGSVGATDTHNLRHLLYSCASENGTVISQSEANILFEIKEATNAGENSPDWKLFFSQAIGNHLMAHNFDAMQENVNNADYALFRQNFFTLAKEVLSPKETNIWEQKHSDEMRAIDSKISLSEKNWLDAKIDQDGHIDEYEKAALDFIAANRA